MSLSKLPVELHELIIDFVESHHPSLVAFSQVSKYYLAKATPALYRDINLRPGPKGIQLEQLTQKILDRPEYALHIRTIAWHYGRFPVDKIRLVVGRTSKTELIDRILGHEMRNDLGVYTGWSHILNIENGYVRLRYWACLALVLSQATRIENVTLRTHKGQKIEMLAKTLAYIFAHRKDLPCTGHLLALQIQPSRPIFSRLKRVLIWGTGHIDFTINNSLKVLELGGFQVNLRAESENTSSLQELTLRDAFLNRSALESLMKTQFMRSLKKLKVIDSTREWGDYSNVQQNICLNLQQLEHLEWRNSEVWHDRQLAHASGSLAELRHLKVLKIDLSFLTGRNEQDDNAFVLNPSWFLPPNLEALHLLNLDLNRIDRIILNIPFDELMEYGRSLKPILSISYLKIVAVQKLGSPHAIPHANMHDRHVMQDTLKRLSQILLASDLHFEVHFGCGLYNLGVVTAGPGQRVRNSLPRGETTPWWEWFRHESQISQVN